MTHDSVNAASDRYSPNVLDWLMRCYESQESWKKKASEVYFASNGDSVLSRQRVAAIVRKYFLEEKPKEETVTLWDANFSGHKKSHVVPPKIDASNAGYVDWLLVADYLLLKCSSPTKEWEEENQRRKTDHQNLLSSYNLRSCVCAARSLAKANPKMNDQEILDRLKDTHKKASLANITEARRLESEAVVENEPIMPVKPAPLPLFKSVYF